MRVLQVVALLSRDNVYGGPATVAINQCRALRELGHDTTLVSGCFRDDAGPADEPGIMLFPARNLAPRLGFAALTSPALLRWVRKNVGHYDVVHVHMARDLMTLPAAMLSLRAGVPTVLQTHGMIDRTDKLLARPLDLLATLPTLRQASGIFYLTPLEEHELQTITKSAIKTIHLVNGVPVPKLAVDQPPTREVLYVARLQARKRPQTFVRAALQLAERHPDVTFTLIGPDEGEGEEVTRMLAAHGSGSHMTWLGPMTPEAIAERMSTAALYVLPSVNEPYPMTVLEALSSGVPVIVTDTCGLADEVAAADAGIVVSSGVGDLVSAIDKLLSCEPLRAAMGRHGRDLARSAFSMSSVAEGLAQVYQQVAVHDG